jgi:hypothetical protein
MNELNFHQQMDRYVDGAATNEELTELLLRANAEADGWQQLALRLVESREITAVFRQLAEEGLQTTSGQAAASAATLQSIGRGTSVANGLSVRMRQALLVTALLLVAFVAGRTSAGLPVATDSSGNLVETSPDAETEVVMDETDRDAVEDATTDQKPAVVEMDSDSVADGTKLTIVGFAHLHQRQGARPLGPVLPGARLDPNELMNQTPTVPEDFRRRAQNSGLKVRPVRHVMSLQLADGQTLAVPLDSIGLQYVGQSVL